MNPSKPNNNNNNEERNQPTISRLRPSIAQSIIRPQKVSSNIFSTATTPKNQTTKNPSAFSKFLSSTFQFPLAIPQVTAFGLAMASGNQDAIDHHHHHHQHDHSSSPTLEPEAMRHCSMNMIFNTQPIGTCIVFREFYISGTVALIFYWILLFIIAIGYEYLRLASQRYERMIRVRLSGTTFPKRSSSSSSSPRRVSSNDNFITDSNNNNIMNSKVQAWGQISVPRSIQLTRSFFYVSNVALSFFLMLVIMTYNAQIILAVLAGAFVGHFIFHREISFGEPDKGMACH